MPYLLRCLFQAAYPTDPMLRKTTYCIFIRESPWLWPLQERRTHTIPKRLRKRKKPSVCLWKEATNGKSMLRTYLVLIMVSILRVGCRVEGWLRELLASHRLREILSFPRPTFTTLLSAVGRTRAVSFDSNSYPIEIDTYASGCMVNAPHLFEDLKLGDVGEVEGIKSGLYIKGTEMFKFKIKDDNGTTHKIRILNSLYLPELKRCLLSPQHWVQEAKDNYPRPKGTRMSQDNDYFYVHWGQAKYQKSIPYDPSTNIPILYTTASHMHTMRLPPPLRPWKHLSSDGRGSSNSQGVAAPLTSPNLYLKSL